MSNFEARRQQTAIRCGHVVTTRSGSSFEVVGAGPRHVILQVGPDLLDTEYAARQSVTLNPDQPIKFLVDEIAGFRLADVV